MAQVTVDITEYDSLREGLKEAKEIIKELKKNLEATEKGSRVVINTKKYIYTLDDDALASDVCLELDRLRMERTYYGGSTVPYLRMKSSFAEEEELRKSIESVFSKDDIKVAVKRVVRSINHPSAYYMHNTLVEDSQQYQGFDDIKESVKQGISTEFYKEQADIISSKESVIKSKSKEIEELKQELSTIKDTLRLEYKKGEELLISNYTDIINEYKKENQDLKEEIAELSKTQEEKVAEAEQRTKKAIADLEAIQCKKSKFRKLFS
jgi:hypothetical protein